eukprot:4546652-Prymnesium_polylepis.1
MARRGRSAGAARPGSVGQLAPGVCVPVSDRLGPCNSASTNATECVHVGPCASETTPRARSHPRIVPATF